MPRRFEESDLDPCVELSTHQRRGLGTKLMAFLTQELSGRNTTRIYLLTARGEISEAFYSKIGFYTSPKMILMARRME